LKKEKNKDERGGEKPIVTLLRGKERVTRVRWEGESWLVC